jgi:hydrophobic/amphiphilic exporter-1 (mainly G- bacteria), HAE1 family
MTLTELAIKRPSFIIVIFLALSVLGVFGYTQLRYELLPKINMPQVTVTTEYSGAAPSEVENSVTRPIEDAISGVDKIESVKSTSFEGMSVIVIEFQAATDIDIALQDVQRKVNGVLLDLPSDARTPVLQKLSLDDSPVISAGATSKMPSRDFYQLLKDQIQPAFSSISGVGQVKLIGGDIREIRINLDAEKVRSYGLSIASVARTVNASNLDFPTGTIKGEQTESGVRIAGKFESIEALRNLVLSRTPQGGEIRLRDVAEIQDGQEDMTTANRINGKTSVGISILKQSDANTVEVSAAVRAKIAELEKEYAAQGVMFEISQDQSTYTLDSADAVMHDLFLAVLLVTGVMFLFLHSVRSSLIVLVAIPSSLVVALLSMWVFDFSLNLMTLLALSLVIGILVDDSIVVLENIYHHLEKGQESRTAALEGRNEIGFAALSITLVDVVVFVPLSVITGMIGDIMREFSVVIVCSTLASLFVSFTVTPMLASRFSKLEKISETTLLGQFSLWFERQFHNFTNLYLRILKYSLANPLKIVFSAFVLLVAAFSLPALGFIGSEFVAQTDRGEFIVKMELPTNSSIANTNRIAQQAERLIAAVPEVEKIQTTVGSGSLGTSANNLADITVTLVDRERRKRSTDEVAEEIKEKVRKIPGTKIFIGNIDITGQAGQAPVQVLVSGNNPDSLDASAALVGEALKRAKGVTAIKYSAEQGKPETRVEIDRQKMAAFGLSVQDIGATLKVALTGDDDSKYREGSNEHKIRIMLDKFDRSSPDDLGRLAFVNQRGQQIQLQQFATIYQSTGPTKLERTNRNSSVKLSAYVDATPVGTVVQNFQKELQQPLAGGTSLSYDGDQKNLAESFLSLIMALGAGILFVYFIMVALYDSFVSPFIVLFSIPLASIGALFALALAGEALSIFSMLGIVMLVGLVAKNAILLVDRANENKARGVATYDALFEAGQSRLRPILMTTVAMVIGMLPIALASGAGAEWKNGLAWALIGGLTSSMFLTLIIVPIVFVFVDKLMARVPALIRRGKKTELAGALNES